MVLDYWAILLPILLLLFGNGIVMAAISLHSNKRTKEWERDLEAKKQANDFYLELFGKIEYIGELMRAYRIAYKDLKAGKLEKKTRVFSKYGEEELDANAILKKFSESHRDLRNYIFQKKFEGYGIFIDKELAGLLFDFQHNTGFYPVSEGAGTEEGWKKTVQIYGIIEKIQRHLKNSFGLEKVKR